MSLALHDTALGQVVPFEPREPGRVSMYVCGPTVYGPPHLGHGRFTLVFDVLRRYLEWSGYEVTYVSNITDIDDQIIARAEREGRTPEDVAEECEALWYTAMDAIGVRRPDDDPHATGWVEGMVELVADLVDAGTAYETDDGVYLAVDQVDGYGLLARQSLDSLRTGARVAVDDQKRSPLDFVLWKKAKPGEPTWPSPWGPGRPGWHTECVVMSLGLLGEGFDIHGGGQDLAFPHHENERAQAVALGRPFARHWVHNGFVEVDGEKMSKSLGNFTNLQDLDRLGRSPGLPAAGAAGPLPQPGRGVQDDDRGCVGRPRPSRLAGPPGRRGWRRRSPSQDDLATLPGPHGRRPGHPRRGRPAVPAHPAGQHRVRRGRHGDGGRGLGHDQRDLPGRRASSRRSTTRSCPPRSSALARRRDEARADRDFAEADRLRDEITAAGYEVQDGPDGTRVLRA